MLTKRATVLKDSKDSSLCANRTDCGILLVFFRRDTAFHCRFLRNSCQLVLIILICFNGVWAHTFHCRLQGRAITGNAHAQVDGEICPRFASRICTCVTNFFLRQQHMLSTRLAYSILMPKVEKCAHRLPNKRTQNFKGCECE